MQKVFIPAVIAVSVALLILTLVLTIREKKIVTTERNTLILKIDSLHVELIKTREKLDACTKTIENLSK